MHGTQQSTGKTILIVGIMIPIALLHFVTGSNYNGPYPEFVNGYLIDILLPFGLYFLLCLDRVPIKSWVAKSALVFGIGASVEIAQFFGVPLLGRTFDPLDFVMYATGVLLAAILDMLVFPKIFRFWKPEA
jgi:glycopeptide antibiotics resistance protein